MPGCEGDLHCADPCFRHERAWGKDRNEPVAVFITRASPLTRAAECRVAGCDRERIAGAGLCRFHDQRLHRRGLLTGDQLAAWVASGHRFRKPHRLVRRRRACQVRLQPAGPQQVQHKDTSATT